MNYLRVTLTKQVKENEEDSKRCKDLPCWSMVKLQVASPLKKTEPFPTCQLYLLPETLWPQHMAQTQVSYIRSPSSPPLHLTTPNLTTKPSQTPASCSQVQSGEFLQPNPPALPLIFRPSQGLTPFLRLMLISTVFTVTNTPLVPGLTYCMPLHAEKTS